MDALNVLLANTVSEKRTALEQSWVQMQKIIQDSAAQEQQAQAQMQQQQLATQIQIAQENREDLQAAEKENIQLKAQMQILIDNNKAQSEAMLLQQKQQGDIILKTEPPM